MTNLNKFRQLSRNDRRRLIQSFLFLPIIQISLLLVGYSRLRAVIEKLTPLTPYQSLSEKERIQKAHGIAWIVSIAAEHGLYKATCLRRSLLVWGFLLREGIQSQICFGVRKFNNQLEAHAWVEHQGVVVNDSVDIRDIYQALEFPPTTLGL